MDRGLPRAGPLQRLGPTAQETAAAVEDLRERMPAERTSMWRTAEERRMSDLTRVMEWLERRRNKKLSAQAQLQKQAAPPEPPPPPPPPARKKPSRMPWMPARPRPKEARKAKAAVRKAKEKVRQVTFSEQVAGSPPAGLSASPANAAAASRDGPRAPGQPPAAQPQPGRKDADAASAYRRLYGAEAKGKRLSIVPGNYAKESLGKTELEMKDSLSSETTPRLLSFHHQSMTDPVLQDSIFGSRKSTLLREWVGKLPDTAYERRLKSLMEKGAEPKVEMRILKPEEVLSCRYLRLSKNNIRTLLKLCTDVGMAVDIHPHMVESEIDAKKVFSPYPSVSL